MTMLIDEQRTERLALLGTAQVAGTIALPDGLGQASAGTGDQREHELLLALGTASLMRKAGQLPVPHDAFPAWSAAPAETMRALGPTGEQCLRAILEEEDHELLSAYTARLATHDRRIPAGFIVPLLGLSARHRELEQRVLLQAGARGVWLAKHHPTLNTLLNPDAAAGDHWSTGTVAQRAEHLAQLRKQDPTQARDLLAAGLKQESSKDLVVLLAALQEDLSMADAALLEPLLKSKARDVRGTAAGLLARTPGHELQGTIFDQSKPFIELKGNMILGRRLEVTLPEAHKPEWTLLGIEPKSGRFPTERTAWLGQMLALIHPERWCDRFDRNEEELIALATKNEFSTTLLPAWTDAALLHTHTPMVEALLRLGLKHDNIPLRQQLRMQDLFAVLDERSAETMLLPVVRQAVRDGDADSSIVWMLHAHQRDWSTELGNVLLDWAERMTPKPDDAFNWGQAHQLFAAMRRSLPPSSAERVAAILGRVRETAAPAYLKLLEELAKRLRLRQRMIDSLNEPPTE